MRIDPRVTVMERTNLRYVQLEDLPEQLPVDLATLDLSFISLLKVLPAVCAVLAPRASLLALIKPQFEAGRNEVRAWLLPLPTSFLGTALFVLWRHSKRQHAYWDVSNTKESTTSNQETEMVWRLVRAVSCPLIMAA